MEHDAIIVGGGLTGPLAALALADLGLSSVVVDTRPRDAFAAAFDGRSYSLALGSVRVLRGLGLWDGSEAQPITGIRASDGRPGKGASALHLSFDAAEIGEPFMGQMVEDRAIRSRLLDACDASERIETRFGVEVTGQAVDAAGVTVETADGPLRARLLLGCDGRRSGVAARAGIGRTWKEYGQTSLVCAVEHDRPHDGVAHQFFMPAGPLAILPLRGNRSSIVWTESAARADEVMAMDAAAYLDVLRPRFGSFLGDIRLVGARWSYPLNLTLAERYAAPRVALLGDAAHGIHPIAGQGLNLGVKDVAAMHDVLGAARARGEDVGALPVLERYQRWRRFDSAAMGVFTDAVNRLFSNDDPLLRLGRDLGMGAINALPGVKRRFIREAAGVSGDLPRLMRD